MGGRTNTKTAVFNSNLRRVREGNIIHFIRNEIPVVGEVIRKGENTVMVRIDEKTQQMLDISTNLTVVNHKNYDIQSLAILSG